MNSKENQIDQEPYMNGYGPICRMHENKGIITNLFFEIHFQKFLFHKHAPF